MTTDRKAGHTKGPWAAKDNRALNGAIWIGAEHPEWGFVSHAEVRSGCDEADELGDMEANARLIAAAPDLLAACEGAVEWLSGWASADPYIGQLQAAIARAQPKP